MHDSLVVRHRTLVDPALFRPMKTQVKRTRISAWMYLPGAEPPGPAVGLTAPGPSAAQGGLILPARRRGARAVLPGQPP